MKPKSCPTCGRTYIDDTLSFCLEDGAPLMFYDSHREPVTAILPRGATGETPTAQMPAPADQPVTESTEQRAFSGGKNFWIAATVVELLVGFGMFMYFYGFEIGGVQGGPRRIDSIAVMPFANTSGNPDLEHLSDGITESLINSLTRVPDLSVKARSCVLAYKGKEPPPQQIAKDLSVEAVLNGRVVQRGGAVTLHLELVETETGNQIWGERYDRQLSDLTALQSEIARDVSAKLQTKLTGITSIAAGYQHTSVLGTVRTVTAPESNISGLESPT